MVMIGYRSPRTPWAEWERIRSEMGRALGEEPRRNPVQGVLPLRIHEDSEGFLIEAEIPGVEPDTVDVQAVAETLTIRGDRPDLREEGEGESRRDHRHERWTGTFSRTVTLPSGTDAAAIAASFTDGVLRVRVPRRQTPETKKIEIRIDRTE